VELKSGDLASANKLSCCPSKQVGGHSLEEGRGREKQARLPIRTLANVPRRLGPFPSSKAAAVKKEDDVYVEEVYYDIMIRKDSC